MKTNKTLINNTKLNFKPAFPGLKSVDMFASQYPIEPFLVFTEYLMDKPVFGPHPHAGVSVITYMLPDSKDGFINRDSLGNHEVINPGAALITQAGRGIQHDEFPQNTGIETHGFQIWINHADKNRLVEPKLMLAHANEIPEVKNADYKVRVVHGTFGNATSPLKMVTDVNLLHVFLEANKSIVLPSKEMAFVYTINGTGKVSDYEITEKSMISF